MNVSMVLMPLELSVKSTCPWYITEHHYLCGWEPTLLFLVVELVSANQIYIQISTFQETLKDDLEPSD